MIRKILRVRTGTEIPKSAEYLSTVKLGGKVFHYLIVEIKEDNPKVASKK